MAYLSRTVLNDYQDKFATNEKRISEHGMLDLVKNSGKFTDYISPEVREQLQKLSGARLAEIPVFHM